MLQFSYGPGARRPRDPGNRCTVISRVVAQELAPQSGAGVAPTLSGRDFCPPLDISLSGGHVVQFGEGVRLSSALPAPFHNQIFVDFLMCFRLCIGFSLCQF